MSCCSAPPREGVQKRQRSSSSADPSPAARPRLADDRWQPTAYEAPARPAPARRAPPGKGGGGAITARGTLAPYSSHERSPPPAVEEEVSSDDEEDGYHTADDELRPLDDAVRPNVLLVSAPTKVLTRWAAGRGVPPLVRSCPSTTASASRARS